MSYILNIDTAVTTASVCVSRENDIAAFLINPSQKDHAAWLHPAISQAVSAAGISLHQLVAIAISAGPGSYTGLRVGMSAAKGLCYALQKPLITINTLQMMAAAVDSTEIPLLCPMIDARRMEVFTAIYDTSLTQIMVPTNMIVTESSFSDVLQSSPVLFFGNGSEKFSTIVQHPNARFKDIEATAKHMTALALHRFVQKDFDDLAYTEPFYGKEFYLQTVKHC